MDPVLFALIIIGFFAALVIVGLWLAVRDLRNSIDRTVSKTEERNDPFKW